MYIRHYFEYKMHILHISSRSKIEMRLKFEECVIFLFPPETHFKKTGCVLNSRASYIRSNMVIQY
jgi:hypothetical protein